MNSALRPAVRVCTEEGLRHHMHMQGKSMNRLVI